MLLLQTVERSKNWLEIMACYTFQQFLQLQRLSVFAATTPIALDQHKTHSLEIIKLSYRASARKNLKHKTVVLTNPTLSRQSGLETKLV